MTQQKLEQAVILAGGIGKRLRPLTDTIPKPMAPVNNKPFLEYLLELLRDNDITEVVLLLGYLHDKIQSYFGDGTKFNIKIRYSVGDVTFETGKRLKLAEDMLQDLFLLMYCDNYWPLNLRNMLQFYVTHKAQMMVTVYTNKDNITRNNMYVDEHAYVLKYDKSRQDPELNCVDIGFFIVNKSVLDLIPPDANISFEAHVLPLLIAKRELIAYKTDHRYYSISTMERLKLTEAFLKPKKVVFLDRDGVINRKPPRADYVKCWEEFEFLPGAIDAIKLLNQHGYIVIVVTNQPGIARGMMTEADLQYIHNRLQAELQAHGAHIDRIYYCPHGWDEGCDCRKPKPGLLYQAARELNLNLSKSILIGDDERDIVAGNTAGCKTYMISTEDGLLTIVKSLIAPTEK
jgi:D-glycero-D-manno-heptose 1,7-bisphosphate phosphatase